MSRESVELVRRGYEHFTTTGDFLEEAVHRDQRGRSKETGLPVDMHFAMFWTFRDGESVRMQMYASPDEGLEAAGPVEVDDVAETHLGVVKRG